MGKRATKSPLWGGLAGLVPGVPAFNAGSGVVAHPLGGPGVGTRLGLGTTGHRPDEAAGREEERHEGKNGRNHVAGVVEGKPQRLMRRRSIRGFAAGPAAGAGNAPGIRGQCHVTASCQALVRERGHAALPVPALAPWRRPPPPEAAGDAAKEIRKRGAWAARGPARRDAAGCPVMGAQPPSCRAGAGRSRHGRRAGARVSSWARSPGQCFRWPAGCCLAARPARRWLQCGRRRPRPRPLRAGRHAGRHRPCAGRSWRSSAST